MTNENSQGGGGARRGGRRWKIVLIVLALAAVFGGGLLYVKSLQNRLVVLDGERTETATAAPSGLIDPERRRAMLGILKAESDPQRAVWFHVQLNNAEAGELQRELEGVFREAGWPAQTVRTPYGLKPGIFIMVADEEPPAYVETVYNALIAAGFEAQILTGYRAFTAERREQNPDWVGPLLEPAQTHTIVIGSRPQE